MSKEGAPENTNNENSHERTEEVVDALSDNKGGDWKKALAGALDEERLLCALVVLCIYYVGQTIGNAYHENNNNKDEDDIVENCGCKLEHRAFYISWSVICYVLWFGCHSLVLLHNNPEWYNKLKCFFISLFKRVFCIRKINLKWYCFWCIPCRTIGNYQLNKEESQTPAKDLESQTPVKDLESQTPVKDLESQTPVKDLESQTPAKDLESQTPAKESGKWSDKIKERYKKIDHCKYHLWTQYYELYVIGITKNSEEFELNQMDKIIKEAFSKNGPGDNKQTVSQTQTTARCHESNSNEHIEELEEEPITDERDKASLLNNMERDVSVSETTTKATIHGTTTALPRHTNQYILFHVQRFFYYFLGFIRYIAQLAVIPLLMIQILDTYAYLCFTADSYCSMSSQYKLHLDQTAMTFAFYCSLMISLLSTTMLRWFPLPKKSKSSETPDKASSQGVSASSAKFDNPLYDLVLIPQSII